MYDIFYILKNGTIDTNLDELKERFPLAKVASYTTDKCEAVFNAQKKSLTTFFWLIDSDYSIDKDFQFEYIVPYWDSNYVHVWKNSLNESRGLYLIPKKYHITKNEAIYLFFVNKKEMDIIVSRKKYNLLQLSSKFNNFDMICNFQKKCNTSMFWLLESDCLLTSSLDYTVLDYDNSYVHEWQSESGEFGKVRLIPNNYAVTNNESNYLFFVNKKEMYEILSKVCYETLKLKTEDNIYEVIIDFQNKCNTSMFWVQSFDCKVENDLTYVVPSHDKKYIHQWSASNTEHLRLNLIPKDYIISKREAENLFFINKKIMIDEICKEEYDIIFISYNEPNADKNWTDLLTRFPRSKRVHGIKGIHNAHIQAAKISETSMFWVIDGDAQIVEDFNLDYVVNPWDKDSVFVWKSKNPINNLIYGYGGVKLLPKRLTLKLDTSTVDMTTSISNKFNPMSTISNITVFNTDPFNTWKSAFRECVKLSSKTIEGQIDKETFERLDTWCTVGINELYGEYSIKGAITGKEFGLKYSDNPSMLSKINDWKWLEDEFNKL